MMRFLQNLKPVMLIEYLPMAVSDLYDMGDHYRKVGGNKLARRMVGGVKSEILVLRDFPELPPIYELAPGVRRPVVLSSYSIGCAIILRCCISAVPSVSRLRQTIWKNLFSAQVLGYAAVRVLFLGACRVSVRPLRRV